MQGGLRGPRPAKCIKESVVATCKVPAFAPAGLLDPQLLSQTWVSLSKEGTVIQLLSCARLCAASPASHLPAPAEQPREGVTAVSAEPWVASLTPGALRPASQTPFPPGAGVAGWGCSVSVPRGALQPPIPKPPHRAFDRLRPWLECQLSRAGTRRHEPHRPSPGGGVKSGRVLAQE